MLRAIPANALVPVITPSPTKATHVPRIREDPKVSYALGVVVQKIGTQRVSLEWQHLSNSQLVTQGGFPLSGSK